ncbi:exostosin-like 2 isoform X2 [Megalobrama amblycephala]|uniref:exostosin-like 2 isoform X2 n=1 Tax=Megalobrama amblycephala TaxID=75352 RepID=UPI0020142BC6|nr:exostosin-like 2 isoform X2 [Megalobrama amblycephala]
MEMSRTPIHYKKLSAHARASKLPSGVLTYNGNAMRIHWCCCRLLGRVRTHFIISSIVLLLLAGVSLTFLLPNNEDGSILQQLRRRSNTSFTLPDPGDSFTIIMQTYNRTDILLRLLNHYQAVPHLQCIIIVWNNPGEPPPRKLWDALGPHPVPVFFKEQSVNRMRNRLQPHPEIKTDAVLMLDDDTLVSVPDISFAFSVWKQFQDQIVGFVPRKHVTTASGVYSYGSFELQDPDKGGGDRLSNDDLLSLYWWFRRGVVFIRMLLAFNMELISGSAAFGLGAPGSLLRPMIKLLEKMCLLNNLLTMFYCF